MEGPAAPIGSTGRINARKRGMSTQFDDANIPLLILVGGA